MKEKVSSRTGIICAGSSALTARENTWRQAQGHLLQPSEEQNFVLVSYPVRAIHELRIPASMKENNRLLLL